MGDLLESQLASTSQRSHQCIMTLLAWLIHPRSETTSHSIQIDRLALFSAPYPMANLQLPHNIHSFSNPHLIVVDHPLASTTRKLTPAEEEYL